MVFRKVTTPAEAQHCCQIFVRESQRCTDVEISPGTLREVIDWYSKTFKCCESNAEWTNFLAQHKSTSLADFEAVADDSGDVKNFPSSSS